MPDDIPGFEPDPNDFAATFDPPTSAAPPGEEDLSFPEEWRRPFEGLFYIGVRRRTFTWMGHQITIRTLTSDEELEVGLVSARYAGSVGESRAYGTALVGACLETIDGDPVPTPIVASEASAVEYRFNWTKTKLHPPVVDAVYEEYRKLEVELEKVLEAMGKAGGSTAG